MKDNKKRNQIIIIGAIFLFAFIIRLIHYMLIKGSPLFQTPIVDAKQYDDWAQEILKTDWLSRSFDFMSPGYPYFLSLIYLVFGHSISAVAIIQFIIGSVNCVLVFIILQKVFLMEELEKPLNNSGSGIYQKNIVCMGFIAALLSAWYGPSIFYEGLLLKVAAINFCNLMMLLMLIQGNEKAKLKYFYFAGLFIGYSSSLRPNIMLFIPFVILWILFYKQYNFKLKVFFISIMSIGILTILILFGLRNYSLNHEVVLTSGHGGINFYLGTCPNAKGIYTTQTFFQPYTQNEHEDFLTEARRRTGKNLTTMEASHFWYNQSYDFIFNHPKQYIKLEISKFFIFWNAYEIPLNGLEYNLCKQYFPLLRFPFLIFGIIAPLALIGMFLVFNRNHNINLLILYVLMYLTGAVIYYNSSEYRFPVVPVFFIFATCALFWFFAQFKQKKYKLTAIALAGLIPLVFFVNNKYYNMQEDSQLGMLYNNIGATFANKQLFDEAIEQYQKAISVSPDAPEYYFNLANTYMRKNMFENAIEEYNKSINILSKLLFINNENIDKKINLPALRFASGVHLKLGEAYLSIGKQMSAINEFKYVLQIDSTSFVAYSDIGVAYAELKNLDKAITYFNKAIELNPKFSVAIKNLNIAKQQKEKLNP